MCATSPSSNERSLSAVSPFVVGDLLEHDLLLSRSQSLLCRSFRLTHTAFAGSCDDMSQKRRGVDATYRVFVRRDSGQKRRRAVTSV
jgi:hypothetical protein